MMYRLLVCFLHLHCVGILWRTAPGRGLVRVDHLRARTEWILRLHELLCGQAVRLRRWLFQMAALASLLGDLVESVVGGVVVVVREFGSGVALGAEVKHDQYANDGDESNDSAFHGLTISQLSRPGWGAASHMEVVEVPTRLLP